MFKDMKKLYIYIAAAIMTFSASAATVEDLKIYINPGHGGYDSDDRNVVVDPFTSGDEDGFWESKSNLVKGLALRDMLEERGVNVTMSRVTNTTADDLALSTIAALANAADVDMFFSIHSNATGTTSRCNYPLMLYRGYDSAPSNEEDYIMSGVLFNQLIKNEATVWTSTNVNLRGCMSFYGYNLGVLNPLTVSGFLSEGSFHDYIPEAYRLLNNEYCWLEGLHFMKAIDDHFELEGETHGYIGGVLLNDRVQRDVSYIMFDKDYQVPVSGALVQLYDESDNLVDEYTTDELLNGFYCFKYVEPGNYTIKASQDSYHSSETAITVEADVVNYTDIYMNLVRSTAPEVISYSPVWSEGDESVMCNVEVEFNFNWDMAIEETEAAFSISPAIDGTFEWEDSNYRMKFIASESYQPNTKYTVTLSTDAAHGDGLSLESPFVFSFTTDDRDYMDILAQSIKDGDEIHYSGVSAILYTDSPMYATNIYTKTTIADADGNSKSFTTRSCSCNSSSDAYGWYKMPLTSSLTVGDKYYMTLSADITDYNGIPIRGGEQVVEFTAVNAGETKEGSVQIEGFEDNTLFAANADTSVGYATATVTKDTSNELFGSTALTFASSFSGDDGEVIYELSSMSDITVSTDDMVGLHVYGDMSCNEVYAQFSSGSDVKEILVTALDYWNWRYITVDLTELEVGKSYQFSGVVVKQTNSLMGVSSSFKMDELLKLAGAGGVDRIEIAELTLYPNPASEYLIANAGTTLLGMELFALSGVKVAETLGNVLNVSDIASGTYVVKVYSMAGATQRQVIIAH